jgi:hypothetical protein
MANYCSFETNISGEPERLVELYKRLEEDGRIGFDDYNRLFDETAPEGFEWGSKWIEYSVSYGEGQDWMSISGDTAWYPATGLWQRISEKYETSVDTTYSEPGGNFAGKDSWENGEKTFSEEMTYNEHLYYNDYEYFWDNITNECVGLDLEDVIDSIGIIYEKMSDVEKQRVADIHQYENE